MKNPTRYTLAIEEPYAGLAEHSAPLILECLQREQFDILMIEPQSQIEELRNFHIKLGIFSGVTYLNSEKLNFSKLKIDAMLTYHTNTAGPLFTNRHSPTNIPRITMNHTLSDGGNFPTKNPKKDPMQYFNVFFCNGPAMLRGSWKQYVKLHPATLKTVKIFEIGSPKTDILFGSVYNRTKVLRSLGLDISKKTVLYTPTFLKEASLEMYGLDIINIIRRMDVNLLIRVHHQSLALNNSSAERRGHRGKDWRRILEQIDHDNANVHFVEGDSNPYFVASDLLIGDVSGACYEFLLQNKPVVFIDTPEFFTMYPGLDGTDILPYWGRNAGEIVSNLENLTRIVELNLANPARKEPERLSLISDLVYNPGHATKVAIDTLIEMLTGPISLHHKNYQLIWLKLTIRQLPIRLLQGIIRLYRKSIKEI